MKKSLPVCLTAFILALLITITGFSQQNTPNFTNVHALDQYNPEYKEGVILVKFRDSVTVKMSESGTQLKSGSSGVKDIFDKYGVEKAQKIFPKEEKRQQETFLKTSDGKKQEVPQLFNIYKLKMKAGDDPRELSEQMAKEKEVEYAEPDYKVYSMETHPDDPLYQNGSQDYLKTINAPAAWDSTSADSTEVIGIIDTGVDWDHPDLDGNIWNNPDEIPDNGKDDDGNGYVDDVRGWDFINNDNDPDDDNSHGTHVAGIAAAEGNNGTGITGVAYNARIMPIKVLQSSGTGNSSDLAQAINYAADKGATVINMSLGSYGESMTVKIALENAYAGTADENGSILVAAAGNDYYKVDPPFPPKPPYAPMYPACYNFVLGVEASNQSGDLAGFSNFDPSGPNVPGNPYNHNYEVRVPGINIMSSKTNGGYWGKSGTSMASPMVAGAVALMRHNDSTLSGEQIFARLIQGRTNGMLDIQEAMDIQLQPDLRYIDYTIVDTLPGSDNDERADAGETIELYLSVKNAGGKADSVWSKLRFAQFEDTSTAFISDSISFLGDLGTYAKINNKMDAFKLQVQPNVANNRDIVLEYEIGAKNMQPLEGSLQFKVQNGYEIGGIITKDTTFTPDKEYILTDNMRIAEGCTLTIEPGVTLKFDPQKQIDIRGSLIAKGTPDSMITFTRNKNEYGNGFYLDNTTDSSMIHFTYCNVEFQKEAIRGAYYKGSLQINNCYFKNCGKYTWSEFCTISQPNKHKTKIYSNIFTNNKGQFFLTNEYYDKLLVFKYNQIINNTGEYEDNPEYINPTIDYRYNWDDNNSTDQLKFENNCLFSNYDPAYPKKNLNIEIAGDNSYANISQNYWGNTDSTSIGKTIYDFKYISTRPAAIFSPYQVQPSDSVHGLAWKVDINNTSINKYDNPYDAQDGLGVVGSETLKFDVHFNRAMDTSVTPLLTFGVREPYTQHVVSDSASWSEDSTTWTGYYTTGLETGDGIQRVRVGSARDDEGFKIPEEDKRFEFLLQAAGAQSVEFLATPGIGKVDLEWPPAPTEDAMGYNLYRCHNTTDSTVSDTVKINSELITDTTYTDFNVIPDTTYHYVYTTLGTDMKESDNSKSLTVTPLSAADGDANGDQAVDVLDITSIVSYLLEEDPEPFLFDAADVNYDDQIDVLDIIGVVDLVSGKKNAATSTATSPEQAYIQTKGDSINLESQGNVAALQFTLEGDNLENQKLLLETSGFEFAYRYNEETDRTIGVIYSLSGNEIPEDEELIVRIKGDSPVSIASATGGDLQGREVPVIIGGTTDIGPLVDQKKAIGIKVIPNPFRDQTRIHYRLPEEGSVTIEFYNINGKSLDSRDLGRQPEGEHSITWSSPSQTGKIIFCRIRAVTEDGKVLHSEVEKLIEY